MLDSLHILQPPRKKNEENSVNIVFWDKLSLEDKTEFTNLRNRFLQNFNSPGKDRRVVTFANELIDVLKYIDRDMIHREERAIAAGVCFAGPYICINTRQLKYLLGRCKSSINGSLQQMGYTALRTKAKAKNCIVSILKPLLNEPNILRQWTVRCASTSTNFCYLSSFSSIHLPKITSADLYEEKKQDIVKINTITKSLPYYTTSNRNKIQEHVETSQTTKSAIHQQNSNENGVSFSLSVERIYYNEDDEFDKINTDSYLFSVEQDIEFGESRITRSASAGLDIAGDWIGYTGDYV